MITFTISSKNVTKKYKVENHYKAIKEFFLEIAKSKIDLEDIGLIAYCEARGMEIRAFRTLPALFALGIIRWDTYKTSTRQIANFSRKELLQESENDKWMGEYIQTVLDSNDPEDTTNG